MAAPKKKSPVTKRVTAKKVVARKRTASKKPVQSKDNSHFEVLATIAFTILAFLFFALVIVRYTWQ